MIYASYASLKSLKEFDNILMALWVTNWNDHNQRQGCWMCRIGEKSSEGNDNKTHQSKGSREKDKL